MACKDGATKFPAMKSLALPAGALKGKVAVVTGGGTGLGKAMALAFAGLGAQVAIAARRMDVLEATAKEISAATGSKVIPITMNVKNPDDVAAMASTVEAELGLPNIVVNNAAGNFISPTERLSPNAFRTITDIVLNGTAFVTLEFGKRLIKSGQGAAFLSITTPYARNGAPFVTPSAASKAGVEVLNKSLAAEWGRYGLRFNCIAPGPIYTKGAFDRLDPTGGSGTSKAVDGIPAGRLGQTEELANLAAFVVSDYGSWLNGAIIDLDGGQQRLAAGNTMMGSQLHQVTPEQWHQLEQSIRGKTGKIKAKV